MNSSRQVNLHFREECYLIDKRAIGVFDSGVGGLTVVAEIFRALPHEEIIYFGDTARLPYGTKSREVVRRFALQNARFLLQFPIKMIVVACNTATADALDVLTSTLSVPVVGVIGAGARTGVRVSQTGRIGVIGTTGAIRSGAYQSSITALKSEAHVVAQACPLFVPLVEEGWLRGDVTVLVARHYLQPLCDAQIDTMILGCTHYPLLKPVLQDVVGENVQLVDSATETATEVARVLRELGLACEIDRLPQHQFFVSDYSPHFQTIGERCLGQPISILRQVDLDEWERKNRC